MNVASAPDMTSGGYWAGAAKGKLILQRCRNCGRIRHYPRPLCDACYSFDVEEVASPGLGAVYSWTVTHHAFAPSVVGELPYVLVTADLDEGVRVLGRMSLDVPLRIGLRVRANFGSAVDGIPVLELVTDSEGPRAQGS